MKNLFFIWIHNPKCSLDRGGKETPLYTEFILIYVGLGIVIVMQVVLLILLAVLVGKAGKGQNRVSRAVGAVVNQTRQGIVFCPNCAAKLDSAELFCPQCGMARE